MLTEQKKHEIQGAVPLGVIHSCIQEGAKGIDTSAPPSILSHPTSTHPPPLQVPLRTSEFPESVFGTENNALLNKLNLLAVCCTLTFIYTFTNSIFNFGKVIGLFRILDWEGDL